ncbi:MAG: hypothetical protein LBP53_03730 [Candidatus Peribacteria bacterium]|jgi:hypothetical protein|nr:hypothetical protein [Candidatus Peribacteria bacterium]
MEQSKIIETSKRYIYALKKTQNLTTTELQQSLEERKELYRNDKDFVYAMTILNDEKKYLISQ